MKASFAKFQRNSESENGNISISFALCFVALAGAAGAAFDVGNSMFAKTKFQGALDAAVLAGASSSVIEAYQVRTAQKYFAANAANSSIEKQEVTFRRVNEQLVGQLTGVVKSSLMNAVGVEGMPLSVTSVAVAGIAREPACILAMHPTRKHTLEMNGSVSLLAPQCHIYGNSNHFNDVVDPHTSANYMTGASVAAVGGGHHYVENVVPEVEFGHEIIADPLSGISIPAAGTCTGTKVSFTGGVHVLQPGTYCNGLAIKKGAKVELVDGGEYIISGGSLLVAGGELVGNGTTIFLVESASVDFSDATVKLTAPKTGQFAGLAVVGERVATSNSFADSTIDVHGVFYMPMGDLTWSNTGTPKASAKWSAFVFDGFSWGGSGTINLSFDLAGSDIPYPASMRVIPRPSEPRLVH
jgi:Putative Flp pilus-assembly TadE/G-like